MANTDFQSLLSSPNIACYRSVGSERLLMLALLQIISNELAPNVPTDQASLLSAANVSCYNNASPGEQILLMLALLQIIAGNIGSGGGSSSPDGLTYAGPPTFTPTQSNGLPYIVVDSAGRQWQYFNGGWN